MVLAINCCLSASTWGCSMTHPSAVNLASTASTSWGESWPRPKDGWITRHSSLVLISRCFKSPRLEKLFLGCKGLHKLRKGKWRPFSFLFPIKVICAENSSQTEKAYAGTKPRSSAYSTKRSTLASLRLLFDIVLVSVGFPEFLQSSLKTHLD